MLNIQDRLSLSVFIGKTELLFDRVNSLDFLQISSSVILSLPMLHFRYSDTVSWLLTNKMLFDGARILVNVTRPGANTVSYPFRLNSYKETVTEGRTLYDIDAYYDAPQYWNSSASEVIDGSASTALAEIASLCDIQKTQIESTTDSQLWVPRNMRYHQWARFIGERGFISEQSCMKLAFDPIKGLMYQDVFKNGPIKGSFGLAVTERNVILVTSYKPRSMSGANNNMNGYNSALVEQLPLEATTNRRHEKMDVNVGPGHQLMMSGAVKDKSATGKVQFGYIDPGNSNDNYERGLYQNRRGGSLFSLGVDILTPLTTDISLLDDVSFYVPRNNSYLKAYSSRYKVMAKAIVISGIDYYEKFQLSALSINETYDGTPAGSDKGPLTATAGN